jgi:D-galacturonate reductase
LLITARSHTDGRQLDTHYDIAKYALERKLHVLLTKPAVQTLEHHNELIELAKQNGVICFVEHHKRFDPVYSDARARAANLGEMNFFNAWMSQPKNQLTTFRSWAGKDSDIRWGLFYVTFTSLSDKS